MSGGIVLFIVAIGLALAFVWKSLGRSAEETPAQQLAWEKAMLEEGSAVGRILNNMARPIARLDALSGVVPSRQYRALRSQLMASGKFGGEVEVFVAVQTLCIFISILFIIGGFFLSGITVFVCILLAFAIAFWPLDNVRKMARKRATQVTASLPEFAELLQMVVASGAMGLEAAMGFTAKRVDGVVSVEVNNMLTVIRTNPSEEVLAYTLAGERLGTPEARTFFTSILQSQLEGTKILENLAGQTRQLRQAAYQEQRGLIKKLPVKMVVMFGVHLFPLLFVVALLPALFGIMSLGK